MNVTADQVRDAARSAAAVITPDQVPPLRLDESPAVVRNPARRTGTAWFVPLAAAAAVVVIVVGSVTAGSWLTRSGSGRSGSGQSNGAAAARQEAPTGAVTGVPAYYVTLGSTQALVRATATGATLATIPARTPFVGVTAAADDRTFVLDAQRQVMGPTVLWPQQPAFYLLRLTASGAEASFTRLAISALPQGTAVTGLALSPDGSRLAVEVDKGAFGKAELLQIRIFTLATGAIRTWSATGSIDPVDPYGFTGSGVDGSQTISWTADGRTLAFDWGQGGVSEGVRLLDTTASGGNLIADSRLAVNLLRGLDPSSSLAKSKDHVSQCVTDAIITPDGSAIICGYTTGTGLSPNSGETTTGFIRYSTSTGKIARIFGVVQFRGQAPGDISLYWSDPAGKTLIGGVLTASGLRVGVITAGKFTPLPGIRGLGGAAW